MIPAHELKINNLVNFFWQKDMPLEFLRLCPAEFSVRVIDEECKRLYPIPLTHEILEGCGFEKIDKIVLNRETNSTYYNYFWKGEFMLGENNGEFIFGRFLNSSKEQYLNNIKYLHQLQNIYFALTGEELTVKLPVTA